VHVYPHATTASHVEVLDALQELIIADTEHGVWQRAAAIRAAAGVPDAGRELVLRHLDASEVVIAEAALGALVWTDRPDEGLPVLLRYADRGRGKPGGTAHGPSHVPVHSPGTAPPALRRAHGRGLPRDRPEVRRAAFGQLGDWSPWLTGITDLVMDRLNDLGETMGHIEVANLLKAGGDEVFGAALARLVDRDADDDHPRDPAVDRRARRRIELLARGAVVRSGSRPADADRTALVESARWLAGHVAFAGTATGLLVDLDRLDPAAPEPG